MDELFIDTQGTEKHWGNDVDAALLFRKKVRDIVDVPCSVGVGYIKLMAKMACDIEAKKALNGVAVWDREAVKSKLNPLPLRETDSCQGIG